MQNFHIVNLYFSQLCYLFVGYVYFSASIRLPNTQFARNYYVCSWYGKRHLSITINHN